MANEPFAQIDPGTQAYRALVEALRDEPLFEEAFRKGNIVAFDGRDRNPDPMNPATADFPMIRVVPTGYTLNPYQTNTSGVATYRFDFQILSGDKRITHAAMPIVWAVYKAVARQKTTDLNLDFVEDVRFEGGTAIDQDPRLRTDLNQWVVILSVFVDCRFDHATELDT